jgi:peptidoglycan glycosyltransferase
MSTSGFHIRRRRQRRTRAIGALALVAFMAGLLLGAAHSSSPSTTNTLAERFVSDWARQDYTAMYTLIDPAAQRGLSPRAFAGEYRQALLTATATGARTTGAPRGVSGQAGTVVVPVRVNTRLWGTLALDYLVAVQQGGGGEGARVRWSHALLFPGLRSGERLSRHTVLPPRATLLARDGSLLAGGAAAAGQPASPRGAAAAAVVGELGPLPAERRATLEGEGVPDNAIVGVSGLELALDDRLRGTPGGQLLAGTRVLASTAPRAAAAVRTTVSPAVQSAAVSALGGQYGGVVAFEPASGEILAVAGIGLEALQPPGSTFKMVTVTAALEAGVAHTSTVYPYATYSTLDGVKLNNANGEDCGGTLALAFAVSCNSVFAPLGVKVGAQRLVATAERFGFNHPSGVPGAAQSSLPPAAHIQGELDVGSTAIGQGEVQASPLQMAVVAATVGEGGHRPQPTFVLAGAPGAPGGTGASGSTHVAPGMRVMSPSVARTVRRLMIGVVREGTGTAAAIPGVTVAGKTGTAELGMPSGCKSGSEAESSSSEHGSESSPGECSTNNPHNTDAWFAAFAPALHPRIAVGVLMVRDGAGGESAAPVARQVLEAGLRAIH